MIEGEATPDCNKCKRYNKRSWWNIYYQLGSLLIK
jgi:hypothetical protein